MVQDLLDATNIEAGRLALELEVIDLCCVVRDVADLFSDTTIRHELSVDVTEEPLFVRCDPLRIEQTLTNLVSNAIKYSPRGGRVRISVRREGDAVQVCVSDEGVGIGASDLEHIWEPFRRTGLSRESVPGVGLGLWTAKRLVEAHQGTIKVESTLGSGSTFTVSLPLAAEPPRSRSAEEEAPATAGLVPAAGQLAHR
jgi:signal transduction histidine kinase